MDKNLHIHTMKYYLVMEEKDNLLFVTKSCHVWLCNTVDSSTSGFPFLHQLSELAQIHVHRVGDTIPPPHPLLSTFSFALNLSQHQSLFQWVGSSHQVAKVLELQLQHESFQWIFRVDFLKDWLVWSCCSPRDSKEYSSAQFKNISSLVLYIVQGILQARILEWVAFPFHSPRDFPNPEIKLGSPALQADSYQLSHQGALS